MDEHNASDPPPVLERLREIDPAIRFLVVITLVVAGLSLIRYWISQAPAPKAPETSSNKVEPSTNRADTVLSLLQITSEDEPDETSIKHFILHVPIKARPDTPIDVRNVVAHILFYDLVDGQTVVQTAADVNSRWTRTPADWTKSDTEELAVEYRLPKAGLSDAQHENRVYYGYLVRLYYDRQLQASFTQPKRLAQEYPPPPVLPPVSTGVSSHSAHSVPSEITSPSSTEATMGLLPISSEDEPDENSTKHFVLHIPVTALSDAQIDAKDVVIHVLFYDIVDGQKVVQTSANVNSKWVNSPAHWINSKTEELTVDYQLPKSNPSTLQHEDHKYFGYIVRLYYKRKLQASSAQPKRLAQQYPPPVSLF